MSLAVAVAGCGYFSQFHRDAWGRMGDVRVVGLADRNCEALEAAAASLPQARLFDDVSAMLDALRPDLLDVVTPPGTHLDLVRAAADRGVACVCQKPLAPDYPTAEAIVDAAERAGTLLVVHENFRWMPWFMEAATLLTAGLIGRPLNVTFRLRPGDGQGPRAYLDRQPYFQAMPRFLVHETAVHLIDVFRFLLGEVTGVFARLRRLNPAIAGEDAGLIVFDFASGAAGVFDGNRLVDHPARDTRMTNGAMLLEGTAGAIRLDGYGRLFVRPMGGEEEEHDYAWEDRGYGGDCVFNQCRHVADGLLGGTAPVNTGRDYLRNLVIQEAVYRSAAEERFIRV